MSDIERVSQVLDVWLREEVEDSNRGCNQFFDDFETTRRGLMQTQVGPDALDAKKSGSHNMRYKFLLEILSQDMLANHDYVVGKLIHHSLMFTSGAFRLQSFLRAGNQAEYEALRFGGLEEPNGATTVPIHDAVTATLADTQDLDFDTYLDTNRELNRDIHDRHKEVAQWFRDNPGRTFEPLEVGEAPVVAMETAQRSGLVLAASHICIVSALRGIDVGEVPVLEPKSITDADMTDISAILVQTA